MIQLIKGDCLVEMQNIPDKSIDLTVTSPPYDNLRTYNGSNALWGEHVWEGVIDQLFRITKDGGVVVWVVADATINATETGTSFKQALYFKGVGFSLHDTMIYNKINPVPLNHNRYEQCFEYMFVFVKGKIKTFNPIKIPCSHQGNVKSGNFFHTPDKLTKRNSNNTNAEKIKSNIWSYSVGGSKLGHPAVFPEQLANDHIISWSNDGDLVFDPFMGSGTTGKMAELNNRNFIGIEMDETYFEIAKKRIADAKPDLKLEI